MLHEGIFKSIILHLSENGYKCTLKQLQRKNKTKMIVEARQIAMYIIRQMGFSYMRIARAFHKNHATVINACRSVEESTQMLDIANTYDGVVAEVEQSETNRYTSRWSKIFNKYVARCQICGEENIVEIHHIKPRQNGGSDRASNIRILCPNHHKMLHLGMIKIKQLGPPQERN